MDGTWTYQNQRPKGTLDRFRRFAELTAVNPCTFNPSKLSLYLKGSPRHLIMFPCPHPSPHPKRHLDWFSRFCGAHDRDRHRQANGQTTLYSPSVAIEAIYVILRCGLIVFIIPYFLLTKLWIMHSCVIWVLFLYASKCYVTTVTVSRWHLTAISISTFPKI